MSIFFIKVNTLNYRILRYAIDKQIAFNDFPENAKRIYYLETYGKNY